jgi:hypothetical protein
VKNAAKTLLSRARKTRVSLGRRARSKGRTVISDLLVLAGAAVACHALFLIWRPAGFLMVAGSLVGAGLLLAPARPAKRPAGDE